LVDLFSHLVICEQLIEGFLRHWSIFSKQHSLFFKPLNILKMKSIKNLLIIVTLAFASNFAHAGDLPVIKKTETTQIQDLLKSINFSNYVSEKTKLNISFFINAQNEVIVVATNNTELDSVIKTTLNYKKIAVNELAYDKIYTMPLVIK
jgi:hypothetical protein